MPEHHHGAAGADLLPLWVRVAWIVVLGSIAATHAVHVLTMRGQRRGWHGTHLLMGVGMLYMVTPWVGTPGSTRAWQYLFAATAVALLAWLAMEFQAGRAVNFAWVPAGVGLAAMAYMFLLHRGHGVREVTYAFVAWHLAEAAAWAHGWLNEYAGRRRSLLPYAVGPGGGAPALAGCSREVAFSQAAMGLAMGYMFFAMDADAAAFFGTAFASGAVTEQTVWATSLIALVVLACMPPHRRPPAPQDPAPQDRPTTPTAAGMGATPAGERPSTQAATR
jgi:hypothetical protein